MRREDENTAPHDPPRGRIRWLCRRGMKELDVLLEGFFAEQYDSLPAQEQRLFHELLQCEDPELHGYLIGRSQPESPDMQTMVERIGGYRIQQRSRANSL